jgi:hypothetical protein
MEKIILKYLESTYQGVYFKKTKFGRVLMWKGESFINEYFKIQEDLEIFFNYKKETYPHILDVWAETKPSYEPIENSTNQDVLVSSL